MRPEVERRLVHAAGAVFPLAYVSGVLTWTNTGRLLLLASAVALALEALRLSQRLELRIFDRLTREYEQDHLAGYALYVLSMTATAWLFSPAAAVPGMLMLAVADPISGLLSTGELRPIKRTFVLLAMFGVCTLLALPFVSSVPAILGGLAATVADGVKPVVRGYVVDDNLTIPPAAAGAITLGLRFAG
ncbi:dolichol kinase [Natronomonas sp. EA1]|uniref:dolichol kinase n=1 Tax=Natronomonas sp. EA1 TaxID=3421655 RepID=UPI003EBDF6FE